MGRTAKFHEGEIAAQQYAREAAIAARNSASVDERIVRGALAFLRQQNTMYVGSIDPAGRVWASIVIGEPGFLKPSEDASQLDIDLARIARQQLDPLWENIQHDDRLGLLLVELHTRRRLKINGEVSSNGKHLTVNVTESTPICPRYIHRRQFVLEAPSQKTIPSALRTGSELGQDQLELIEEADTFFLASVHETHGADCSHRGGPPGFVRILDGGILRIPDYNGNSMFNSFGNFLLNPQAGLVFPDYARKRILQMNGTVEVFWDEPDTKGLTGGTGRFWEFRIAHWLETDLPEGIDVSFIDFSPFLPKAI